MDMNHLPTKRTMREDARIARHLAALIRIEIGECNWSEVESLARELEATGSRIACDAAARNRQVAR